MTKKYFLHIPRTSGRSIINQLHLCGINIRYSDPDSYEPDISRFIIQEDEILTGHLGAAPILDESQIVSFSIIRNPVEHFVSLISYSSIGMGNEDKIKIAELILNDKNLRFPFIPNMQSTFLTSRFTIQKSKKLFPEWTTWVMADLYAEKTPNNIEEVAKFIETNKINLATMENRKDIIKKILKCFGINKTPPNVIIGKEHKDETVINFCFQNEQRIIESNMIDFELFTRVSKLEAGSI